MKLSALLAVAIILPAPRFVNAHDTRSTLQVDLRDFLKAARIDSEPDTMTAGLSAVLDVPAHSSVLVRDVDSNETTDGAVHGFILVLSTATDITSTIFRTSRMVASKESESYYFKTDKAGDLQKVVRTYVAYKDGKVVRGSGRSEAVDPSSPDGRHRFQHELDFWLKGKYRKKKAKSK